MDRISPDRYVFEAFDNLCCELDRAHEETREDGSLKYRDAIHAIYAIATQVLTPYYREALEFGIEDDEDDAAWARRQGFPNDYDHQDDYEATHGRCQKCGGFAFVADEGICRECYIAINGE